MVPAIDRRCFLRGVGVTGVAGLAGCGEESDPDEEGTGVPDVTGDAPDVLTIVGDSDSGVQLFQEYYEMDVAVDILVPDGMFDPALPEEVDTDMGNVGGIVPTIDGSNREAFTDLYENEFEDSPGVFAAHSFDASAILILANAAAGQNDGAAIRDQMRRVTSPGGDEYGPGEFVEAVEAAANGDEINYQGASSPVEFDERGDPASAAYEYWRFTDDEEGYDVVKVIEYEGEPGGESADESPGGTGREIRLGILAALTGDLGPVGGPIANAGELPAILVNDADLDLEIDVHVDDTETDREAAITAANELVSEGYPMVNGGNSSTTTITMSDDVFVPNEVVCCSPASTAHDVSMLEDDGFVFRTAPSDLLQGAVLARIAAEELGADTLSTLHEDSEYGQALSKRIVERFEMAHGGEVYHQVPFEPQASSYSSELSEALSEDESGS